MDLPGYNLGGSISPYVGSLSFLRVVSLSDNFLHGEISQQVTHLFRLQHLNLSSNLLTGEILSNFTNCPQLRVLDFQRNNLTGNISVELGSLKRLVWLDVASNHLTGGIPPSLGNVSSLQVLHFSFNYFVGNIPDEIGHLQSMEYNGNDFKALVYEFMENGNLDRWLHQDIDNENRPRHLSLLQRLNIVIDVASALHYLHDHCEAPIIHCDLKPSNVLLDDDMIAKVSDFGLAKIHFTPNDVSHSQTSTVGMKGTIGYAAPGT
ncbi:putative receptor-like protein kinase At3g47110 [Corylus avellana]|uniref:putative receptor-like protein kinase At3g47110 n=1 Tax=Corylus avellana TaxID=13451 RepID=UPI00286C2839|nr:putative receptor-like protein kinase At3g47110 [Corylus avellana]